LIHRVWVRCGGFGAVLGAVIAAALPFLAFLDGAKHAAAAIPRWAIAGSVLGCLIGVVTAHAHAAATTGRVAAALLAGVFTGSAAAAAMTAVILRGDNEVNDALVGRALMGGFLGLMVSLALLPTLPGPSRLRRGRAWRVRRAGATASGGGGNERGQ